MTVSKPEVDGVISQPDASVGTHIGDKVVINDIYLKTVNGEVIDLLSKYSQIIFYENMFSSALSGLISIKDTEGLLEKYVISGGEEIGIKVSKPNTNDILIWRVDLVVHRVSRSEIGDNLNTSYNLHFTTKFFVRSMKRRLFKSFKNQSFVRCVESIYKEISDNSIAVEDPGLSLTKPFISTGLNPHSAIEFLCKRSCAKGRFFVFFERLSPITGTIQGAPFVAPHYFGSVEKLIQDSNNQTIYNIVYREKVEGQIEVSLGENSIRTPKFIRLSNFNHLDAMMTGLYNSKITTIDPITRTFNLKKLSYVNKNVSGDFYSNALVSGKTIFSEFDDTRYDLPGEKLLIGSYNDPYGKEEWLSSHIYGQVSKNLFKVQVIIEGGTNNIGVGSIVNVRVPSHYKKLLDPQNPQLPDDVIYSGKYIVTAVRHTIVGDNYGKEVELSRGSMNFNLGTNTNSRQITNLENKPKSTKLFNTVSTRVIKNVIGNVGVTFLGTRTTITRNIDGNLSQNSKSYVAALGIELNGALLTDRSYSIMARSIKNNDFSNVEDVIRVMYPGNINSLTSEVLLNIKSEIEALL